jgi:hypothetical protein
VILVVLDEQNLDGVLAHILERRRAGHGGEVKMRDNA